MESFDPPKTRAEFERNFHLMSEALRNGKILFAEHVRSSQRSLMKVWSLPNGRIDFLSVDESARLSVNMMSNMMEQIQSNNTGAEASQSSLEDE